MREHEAIALISQIIGRGRNIAVHDISPDTRLADDLGLDSLDAAELLAALHKETGKTLNADSLEDFETVRCVADLLLAAFAETEETPA